MNTLLELFNVNNTFFTIFNYQMSYVEFFGTLLNITTVWLLVRKNILNWPIGILGVLMFGALFYQLQLYADLFEQVYYFFSGFWGWYAWTKARPPKEKEEKITVTRNDKKINFYWFTGIAFFTLIGGWAMTNLSNWLPTYFPEPASLPYLDVLTTVMSFAAQIMLIQRRLENWLLWIVVDIIGIGLYLYKGVPFVALLYAGFLILATNGYLTWRRTYKEELKDDTGTGNRKILPATPRA